ncbi:hypothetical protein AB0H71_13645 [Nocardia sp. NPDC050697]|uniref:hypothetical protein n=1 Tax=Nocardia sp. NPDC050697 TaxID=3155158 RepID=UPI0033EC53A8
MNPLRYKPSQIAKFLVALLGGIVGLLGVAADTFATGMLASVGQWATTGALVITPIWVFFQKVEPWIGMVDNGFPDLGSGRD